MILSPIAFGIALRAVTVSQIPNALACASKRPGGYTYFEDGLRVGDNARWPVELVDRAEKSQIPLLKPK